MDKLLEGKVAVVTGAGRGIGRGEAIALAAAGAKVLVNDLGGELDGVGGSVTPADQVVSDIKQQGGTAVANYDTVATIQGAEKIIKTAVDNFGALHILVNNAGILRDREFHNMSEEEWDSVIKVHLYGHFYCTRVAVPHMLQQRWGRIINTSSMSGLGFVGQANYGAAKEGIVGFTRNVARDLGQYGVTCNAIRPSARTRMTLTPELRVAMERVGYPNFLEELKSILPEDVAPLVVYLASEQAASINGCVLRVVGGEVGIYPEPQPIKSIFKEGRWTVEELIRIMPKTIEVGLVNPAPPKPKILPARKLSRM